MGHTCRFITSSPPEALQSTPYLCAHLAPCDQHAYFINHNALRWFISPTRTDPSPMPVCDRCPVSVFRPKTKIKHQGCSFDFECGVGVGYYVRATSQWEYCALCSSTFPGALFLPSLLHHVQAFPWDGRTTSQLCPMPSDHYSWRETGVQNKDQKMQPYP